MATLTLAADATGFQATGGSLALGILTSATETYTGVAGSLSTLGVVGITQVTLELADLELLYNTMTSTGSATEKLNWFDFRRPAR